MTATEMVRLVGQGEMTRREFVEAHLERIAAHNGATQSSRPARNCSPKPPPRSAMRQPDGTLERIRFTRKRSSNLSLRQPACGRRLREGAASRRAAFAAYRASVKDGRDTKTKSAYSARPTSANFGMMSLHSMPTEARQPCQSSI